MNRIVWLLGLTLSLGCPAAWALPTCTDREAVAKVCASRPTDDSGFGTRLEDFPKMIARTSEAARVVSPEAYDRFVQVLRAAVRSYWRLSNVLPDRDRAWMRNRLATLRVPSREELAKSPLGAVVAGADAHYSRFTDGLTFSPMILNSPALSSAELLTIVAHELGHFLDPMMSKSLLQNPATRLRYLDAATPRCFEEHFRAGTAFRAKAGAEDYADWMAAAVVADYVEHAPTEELARRRLLTSAYVFCEGVPGWAKRLESSLDSHSPGAQRVLTLVDSPRMLALLGCAPTLIEAEGGAGLGQCSLGER